MSLSVDLFKWYKSSKEHVLHYNVLTILADLGVEVDTYQTRCLKTRYFFNTNTKELVTF